MSYIIILFIIIIAIILLKILINVSIKEIKNIANNKKLDEITNKFPENIEICKKILNITKNKNVKIEENKDNKSSFYFIATNTINIANIRDSFTRVQTIAHECIHANQDKKLLWFNYIFSNIYLIYFLVICIAKIFRIIDNNMIYLAILLILNTIWIFVREFLETDAMTKARYLSEKYIKLENEENKIIEKEDIEEIMQAYDNLNNKGIKLANYQLFLSGMVKIIIYLIISIIVYI